MKPELSVLLTSNIAEYVTALVPYVKEMHVVDNAQRVGVEMHAKIIVVSQQTVGNDILIIRYLNENKVNVIYAQGRKSLCRYKKICRQINRPIKIIVTCHSGYVFKSQIKGLIFVFYAALFSNGIVFLANRYYEQYKLFCKILRLRAWTIPNCIDILRFPKNYNKNKNKRLVLGSVGVITPNKGYHDTLRALALLKSKNIYIKLIIAGQVDNCAYKAKLDRYINSYNLVENVEWLGKVNYKDIPLVLQKFDVYVSASYCEMSPFSIIEAMASSLPVIATDVGGVADLVNHETNGYLLEKGNVEGLAKSIELLLCSAKRKSFGENSYQRALSMFSANIIGEKLVDVLSS